MSHSSHGRRIFAFALLALATLFVLTASRAEAAGKMRVAGAEVVKNETLTGTGASQYLVTVPPQNLIMHCKTVKTHWIWLSGSIFFEKEHLLSDCVTLQNGKESPNCKPSEPIVIKEIGLPILHNSKTYILNEPFEGKPLTTIKFNEETCALAPENQIKGSYVTECLTSGGASGDCSEELVSHSVQPASAALFPTDTLKFGASAMTFEGKESVALSGVNVGKTWSVTV